MNQSLDWIDKVLRLMIVMAIVGLILIMARYSHNLHVVNTLTTTGTDVKYGQSFAGIYTYDGWICYDSVHPPVSEMNKTIVHEECHALVAQNHDHFCDAFQE